MNTKPYYTCTDKFYTVCYNVLYNAMQYCNGKLLYLKRVTTPLACSNNLEGL